MAQGDQTDFIQRMRALVPYGWFPDVAPDLGAILAGLANMWAWAFSLLAYVKLQTRIATATDIWLDTISADFFGIRLPRGAVESDASFRARIQAQLLQPAGTRAALIAAVTEVTGFAPLVFEPRNPRDTGGYGHLGMTQGTGLGYGIAGGYGSMILPFQAFVIAFRPHGGGVANVAGYGHVGGLVGMPGGYGHGALEYAQLSMVLNQVTDTQIDATIANVIPAAGIAWTALTGAAAVATLAELDVNFVLDTSTLG